MSTARHARDLGRPLMAVPGPVTSDLSAGCHHIIRNWRGSLVTSAGDVIDTLTAAAPLRPTEPPGSPASQPQGHPALGLLPFPSPGGLE